MGEHKRPELAAHLIAAAEAVTYNERPFNSIRFICRCGRRHHFPRSTDHGKRCNDADWVVTDITKEVHCVCGLLTSKGRADFRGNIKGQKRNL